MGNRVIFCGIIISFLCCACTTQEEKNRQKLINAVTECINFVDFFENIISVEKIYSNSYDLYKIEGYLGVIVGLKGPSEILKVNGKYVFLFTEEDELPEKEVLDIVEKHGYYERNTNPAFYYAQCRDSGKDLLVKSPNRDVLYYEIPEIREFSCDARMFRKDSIELIIEDLYVSISVDSIDLHESNIERYTIESQISVYNRTDSELYFGMPEDSLGYFWIQNGHDSIPFDSKNISLYDLLIDDPTYEMYQDKVYRFSVDSKEIFPNEKVSLAYVMSLIRDSLYYVPNVEKYRKAACGDCVFPTKKIKVIVPENFYYSYVTPTYCYTYYGDELERVEETW